MCPRCARAGASTDRNRRRPSHQVCEHRRLRGVCLNDERRAQTCLGFAQTQAERAKHDWQVHSDSAHRTDGALVARTARKSRGPYKKRV